MPPQPIDQMHDVMHDAMRDRRDDRDSFPLYLSSNGDEWHMVRDMWTSDVHVLHRANAASGGTETLIEVGPFLSLGDGPEQQELRRLIKTVRTG